jgi:hypothetical protein
MYFQSSLTIILTFAASSALAQCRGPAGTRDVRCDLNRQTGQFSCDSAATNAIEGVCGQGQRASWREVSNLCDSFEYCEYEVCKTFPC